MAANAPQIQYRQEYIHGFEQRQSLLRDAVTSEAVFKGNQATFLVADSGSATSVTRGVNGLIPARADNNTQYTATLTEEHDLVRKTGFNIFESQGDQRRIMQETSMAVLNRKIDSQILTALDGTTTTTGATGVIASLNLCVHAKAILGNNKVPFDGNIWAVISPAFEAYLLQVKEFGSADYVTAKPLSNDSTAYSDRPGFYSWLGVKWVVHPGISGAATSSEKCFMFHKSAMGHAANVQGMDSTIGYDDEQDYSYARCSLYMGAKLLQNGGIVEIIHDGSGYAAG